MAKRESGQPSDRALYIISVAAELAGVHPQTLRIYERKGLLRPARTAGNTRRYSDRDIARLQMIQRLTQEEGLNLAGVKMIVEMEDQLDRMRRRVQTMDRELRQARERLARELERLHREYSQVGRTAIVPASAAARLAGSTPGSRAVQGRDGPGAVERRDRSESSATRRGPFPMGPAGGT